MKPCKQHKIKMGYVSWHLFKNQLKDFDRLENSKVTPLLVGSKEHTSKNFLDVFHKSIKNVTPEEGA